MRIDHLVVVAETLEAGEAAIRASLGTGLDPGGRHPQMGTQNALLSLGDAYVEVIAIDPEAPPPGRPRWFGLDHASGPPRLAHWVARPDDLAAALREAPMGLGETLEMSRSDLSWRITVPPSGAPPLDGVVPALIAWEGPPAAARLPDRGLRLKRLRLVHPRMGDIAAAWPRLAETPGLSLEVGPGPDLRAEIDTPEGTKTLSAAPG